MPSPLTDVARRWTALGSTDPMRAALTEGSHWDVDEFLRTGRSEIDALLAVLARRDVQPKPGTALDFGCGPGRLTAALAAAGFSRAIGMDVSPTMLAKAREIVADGRCEFVLNERPDLASIPSDTIDLVYTSRVLQHMPPSLSRGYIGEFLRVAAPGAIVAFQLPYEPAAGLVGTGLKVLPAAVLDRLRGGMQMHGAPPAAVTRLIAECGGVTVSVEEDASAGPRWRSHLYIALAKS